MKSWVEELQNETTELQIAPLIDVVFLLLIYFMVTSSLIRSEADIRMMLPGKVEQTEKVKMPDEQIIEVLPSSELILNGRVYQTSSETDLNDLQITLLRYRKASKLTQTKAMITIKAADLAKHDWVVAAMNACAGAGIKHVTFGR